MRVQLFYRAPDGTVHESATPQELAPAVERLRTALLQWVSDSPPAPEPPLAVAHMPQRIGRQM